MSARSHVLSAAIVGLLFALVLGAAPRQAAAEESWQFHYAQANSYYRNRLLPKALE